MNKNQVSVPQISLLLLLVITGGKFLSLPALLAQDVGHDSWLVVCVAFFWDLICLCFLLWAIRLNKNRLSFDAILDKTLSRAVSKIVLAVFFVIFMCRVILLLDSCYNTFAITFDVNTNWLLFMLPIVGVAAFAIFRGFNSVARTGQILFAMVLVAIVALMVTPTIKTDFSELLPVGEAGFGKIVGTAFLRSFWFSDYIFILFVLEDIKLQKRLFSPVLTCFGVGVALTVLLNAVFVALFGEYAQYNNLAMSKIGLFSVSESASGRWDWLTLTVWLTSVMLKIIIFIFCSYKCVEKIFGLHFTKTNPVVMIVIAAILLLPMFLPVRVLVEYFIYWCVIPFAVIQYILPLILPLLTNRANKGVLQSELQNGQS